MAEAQLTTAASSNALSGHHPAGSPLTTVRSLIENGKQNHIPRLSDRVVCLCACCPHLGTQETAERCRSHRVSCSALSRSDRYDLRIPDCRRSHRCPVRGWIRNRKGPVVFLIPPPARSSLWLCGFRSHQSCVDYRSLRKEPTAQMDIHHHGRSYDVRVCVLHGCGQFPRCMNNGERTC